MNRQLLCLTTTPHFILLFLKSNQHMNWVPFNNLVGINEFIKSHENQIIVCIEAFWNNKFLNP